ncbi:protein RTF1 homolog [Ziziphus jujuba]|uniref:Protein RTF1 homolog n=1 Tax=Ziziphus jujuba TaxID=326968 RepID=A0A6P6FXC5_ZIZJJ|nr:protein RTF1 homolog [Ziziphus jujuba]XP_024926321.3 protein RTF1 homolog [Ziziphus jujuba]XP_060667850.1 protein RTF1 homolog [Ziziphus jujuba]XP_060667851.1 protein RTF1 homolog [Ziziphus jujuba]
MADLENLLLEAAGRTSAGGTNRHAHPPNRRLFDGPSSQDGSDFKDEESDDGYDYAIRKPAGSQVPLKKRFDPTKRADYQGSNEEGNYKDDGSDHGEDSSDESDVGSDLYKNEDDQKKLADMTEFEREIILSDRALKKDNKDFKEKLRLMLDKARSTRCREDPLPPPLSFGVRTSARTFKRMAAMDDALNQLREKRLKHRYGSRGGSVSQHTLSTKRKVLTAANLSSSSQGESVSESHSEDEASVGDGEMVDGGKEMGIPGSEPPTFDDIKEITVQRSKLVKWFMEPYFEDLIVGCFVRIGVGKSTNGPAYRLCMVQGVDASDSDQHYMLDGKTTSKFLICVSANGSSTTKLQMAMVSDSTPLEEEFSKWVRAVEHSGRKMLSKRDVLEKKEALQNSNRYIYSATTGKQMLQEKKHTLSRPLNIAVEKEQLRRQIEVAESKSDTVEVRRIMTRLQELEASRPAHDKDTKAFRLAEMNRKNKVENLKSASELKPVNMSLKAGDAGYDPFSRRWTRSRNYYASSKAGGEDEAPEEKVGTSEVDINLGGVKLAGDASVEVTKAAIEAAADAGKLVDTGAPVDKATEYNILHNFELPISLAKLKKFGGPQGAHLGYMARKQRIEATVGRQVPEDHGRKHPLALSITDYKRRRGLL